MRIYRFNLIELTWKQRIKSRETWQYCEQSSHFRFPINRFKLD